MVQLSAIFLAAMIMAGTFAIIFFKTNGKVEKGHIFMFLIGFMCFSVAVDWLPAEISFSKDIKITFTSVVKEVKEKAQKEMAQKEMELRLKEKEAKIAEMQMKFKAKEAKIARAELASELTKKSPAIDVMNMIQ